MPRLSGRTMKLRDFDRKLKRFGAQTRIFKGHLIIVGANGARQRVTLESPGRNNVVVMFANTARRRLGLTPTNGITDEMWEEA
jgi:hypothetical protein